MPSKFLDSAALQTQNSAQMLNPDPQLHTPNGTLPITLPSSLLNVNNSLPLPEGRAGTSVQ
jgi:hypothetical protein